VFWHWQVPSALGGGGCSLLHHSHTINIRGDSDRLKEKPRSGIISGPYGRAEKASINA